MKIGIIGIGYWGPNLVKNFYAIPEISIQYICDLDKNKAQEVADLYPKIEKVTTDIRQVVEDKEVSAVVIATPAHTHYSMTKQALFAGKHVLVEKPITDNVSQAEELIRLAEKQNLILMVDHISVYIGAVQKIKEIIEQGELGEILYFTSVRINFGKFQKDVNVVWDLVPHDLSVLKYTIKKQPVAVSAVGSKHLGNLETIAYINLLYDDEVLAHCHVNWLSPIKIRSIAIAGSKKMIVYNDLKPNELVKVCDKSVNIHKDTIDYKSGDAYVPEIDKRDPLAKVCLAFIEAIKTNIPPITDGKYGLDIIKIIEAAQISISKKGEPIPIQF